MSYALIREGGATITEFQTVPDVLENISNFQAMPVEDRAEFGFLPVVDEPPALGEFESMTRTLVYDAAMDRVVAQYAVTVAPVADVRAALWERIKERRQACIEGGAQADGFWYHSDLFSRTQWLGMLIQGAALPGGILWKRMDNSFIALTPTLVQQVFAAIAMKEQAAFTNAEYLKAQINAAPDPRTVDLTAGWPASYE